MQGQVARVHVVEETVGSRIIEVEARWSTSLRMATDSMRAGELTYPVLHALSGGMLTAHENVILPALALPRVQVLSAEYDEIVLPLAAGADTLLSVLEGPQVRAVGLGMERKRPVATVLARLIAYDASTGVFRRYRKLRIRVEYGAGVEQSEIARGRSVLNRALSVSGNPHVAVTRSVLADGVLFKIPVREEGVYRIGRTQLEDLLRPAGMTLATLDPGAIRVFGNGGAPLPALNSAPRPADLVEIPVLVRTDAQGVSEIVFYGKGPHGWTFDAVNGEWRHYVHPFSNDNYYFLKIDQANGTGARIAVSPYPGFPDARLMSSVTGRFFHDFDEVLWANDNDGGVRSGYTWVSRQIRVGETLNVLGTTSLPGLAPGPIRFEARAAIRSNPAAEAVFRSGSTVLARMAAPAVSNSFYDPVARIVEESFTMEVTGGQAPDLTMRVEGSGSGTIPPQAALDWIRVLYPQVLRANAGYLRFVTPAAETGRLEFLLEGFAAPPIVWDVTEGHAIRQLGVQQQGAAYAVQIEVFDAGQPREIVAFTEAALRSVGDIVRIGNQNLHGIQSYPDYVIVVPDSFRTAADELAEHRRRNGLTVEVTGIDQIYNEFSGGLPDMRAVRDYFKFLYDRAPNDETRLRYALLFGDGHYDFRGLLRPEEAPLKNWIFPYETEESFDADLSFTSDDYFGLLDDGEGVWPYTFPTAISQERVDIGIGRLPVQSAADAQAVVAKIKHYESSASLGAWRTRYVVAADDGPTGLDGSRTDRDLHTQNADVVATAVQEFAPAVNLRKIYAESYDRVYRSGRWYIPAAQSDILAAIEEGALAFNYNGHGSPEALAQERLFAREDVAALTNLDRLPLFITATCSFGRWDDARQQSTAEDLITWAQGGAIALMTTVRTVFTFSDPFSLNLGLNRQLNIELFKPDPDGLPRRLGDVLRETKNTPVGLQGNNRKFNLLGDPAMRVGLPAGNAVITKVNDVAVTDSVAQLRALDHVTITGEIRTPAGHVDESFNGTVQLTVYDAERRVAVKDPWYMDRPYFTVREDLLWRGEVVASGGRYQAEFVMPKDISYSNDLGRIAVYAQADNMQQAIGFADSVRVGGTADVLPDDKGGPELALFLNDTTFVSGGLTHPRPELIVNLFDESGINIVGAGVGHEMLLILDGDEANAVDLSSRYKSEGGSHQRGKVVYPLTEYLRDRGEDGLQPGPHSLQVKAWDVLNNSSVATLEFYVSAGEALALRNVLNYPNPMVEETRFVFEHNQPPGTPADVQLRVYTLSGRPVRTIETDEALPGGVLPAGPVQIPWDGRDDDFDRLATGIYLYKLRVRVESPDGDRQVAEKVEKIALIR